MDADRVPEWLRSVLYVRGIERCVAENRAPRWMRDAGYVWRPDERRFVRREMSGH